MKVFHQIVLVAACVAYITCQSINDLDVDDVKKKLEDSIPGIDALDTSKFNTSKLPSEEDVENVLREKCKKKGAEDAVDLLKNQQETVKTCLENYVNSTVIEQELEEAKKTGSMDEVFGKYCKKWPSIYACLDNVTATARLCMDSKEERAFNKSLEIVAELQEFMCFKDGDRLAMFVAEGGVDCVNEQKDGIQNCLNATLGTRLPESDDFSVATLPTFLFSAKDCKDFDTIRTCVNKELEKCKNTTPANIVDAFFKFLKKHMPCGGDTEVRVAADAQPRSWAVTSFPATSVLIIAFLVSFRMF